MPYSNKFYIWNWNLKEFSQYTWGLLRLNLKGVRDIINPARIMVFTNKRGWNISLRIYSPDSRLHIFPENLCEITDELEGSFHQEIRRSLENGLISTCWRLTVDVPGAKLRTKSSRCTTYYEIWILPWTHSDFLCYMMDCSRVTK